MEKNTSVSVVHAERERERENFISCPKPALGDTVCYFYCETVGDVFFLIV